ncbi:MAG TPA: helix-turn-helix domain-containing protein [Gemmataceae bacterium]|jgi:excisionase family DNA binding protein
MPTTAKTDRLLTPGEVAERLSIGVNQALALIRSGKLPASNVGLGSVRPRYRVAPEDLDAFVVAAQVRAPEPSRPRRRRRDDRVTEYF